MELAYWSITYIFKTEKQEYEKFLGSILQKTQIGKKVKEVEICRSVEK